MCRPLLAVAALAVAVLAVPEAAAQACVCPTPTTQANFDADKYLGDWYEMKRVPRDYEDDGQCGMAHYSWLDTAKTAVNVLNTNYVPKGASVTSVTLRAEPDDLANGKLKVTFPGTQVPASKYWVLGTDYDTYAVVYSCTDQASAVTPHITLWVLSRSPDKYTADVDARVMSLIKAVGLDASILKAVDHQKGCPTAACSSCSAPVATLDLAKLKGRWWEVQHSPYSTGYDRQSCGMAHFVSTSDGVIFNATNYESSSATVGADKTMVLQAKWADSNKKAGEFNINNSAGKLCVLGTDYDNWAVVSVCLPSTAPTTTPAPGPFAQPVPAVSGGVYVMARRRGLSPKQQLDANTAVTNAGVPAASMQYALTTPCPAAALVDASGSAAATAPAALLLSVLAAVLGLKLAQ